MIDLDALKRWADFFAPYVEDDNEWYRSRSFDGKDAAELGELFAELYAELSKPVVTPEADAEARDVLAEELQAYAQQFSDRPVLPMYTGHADAGLAALRAHGFAVVRTADVKNANRYATNYLHDPLRVPDWLIRLREAIR